MASCHSNKGRLEVSSFSGNGVMQMADGGPKEAAFANPMGIAADDSGNIYVADSHNNRICKVNSKGRVTTIAGSGKEGSEDGQGAAASFFYPTALALDHAGNIYVTDSHNNLIRKISPGGMVTTLIGRRKGSDTVRLDNPNGIAIDQRGNVLFTDYMNNVVRKIFPDGRTVIVAGIVGDPGIVNGEADSAKFYLPWGIAVDKSNNIYVADSYNNMIRRISSDGRVSVLAGKIKKGHADGRDTTASFFHPAGLATDRDGNIYVADLANQRIRKINPEGWVETIAGNGKRGSANDFDTLASFDKPYGLAIDKAGNIFVADFLNNQVRKISPAN